MNKLRPDPLVIADDALTQFVSWAKTESKWALSPEPLWTVVSDRNTTAVNGARVAEQLRAEGLRCEEITLSSGEPGADGESVLQVYADAGTPDGRVYCACGSGTLTDVVRFVAHHSGRPFVSLPTAPSVDGFTSVGAPMIRSGVKVTVPAAVPTAIFADTRTLSAAPTELIAAGFGDMLGKYSALADWELGELIWGETRDEGIARTMAETLDGAAAAAEAIAQREAGAMATLFQALCESGSLIAENGGSQPASGSEHHVSHALEMRLIAEGRKPALHGAKVGAASVEMARLYGRLRELSKEEAQRLLDARIRPDAARLREAISAAYGAQAPFVESLYGSFAERLAADFDTVCDRLTENWSTVQQIARQVPTPDALTEKLDTVGGASSLGELGFTEDEVQWALRSGGYLRPRFTILTLSMLLGFLG